MWCTLLSKLLYMYNKFASGFVLWFHTFYIQKLQNKHFDSWLLLVYFAKAILAIARKIDS